jgi:hypothetical protein
MFDWLGSLVGRFRREAAHADSRPQSRDDYFGALAELRAIAPRAAAGLEQAAQTRLAGVTQLLGGARLAGVNDLLLYLDEMAARYDAHDELRRIAFLVRRFAADFETALEATLSSYVGVAADAMRDVLEVEYLLLDFATDPARLDLWLGGSEPHSFQPRELRKRLRQAGVSEFTSSVLEGADYAAHSAALHVSPREPLIGRKGRASDPLERDSGFWEMFEHGRRAAFALEACGLAFAGDGWNGREGEGPGLSRVADAHARTQEMQTMYVAMVTGPGVLREQLGREPTTHELLKYVRDQLSRVGPETGTEAS